MTDHGSTEQLLPDKAEYDYRFSSDTESLPPHGLQLETSPSTSSRWKNTIGAWIGKILLIGIIATASFWAGTRQNDFGQFIRETSEYSPGLGAITKQYHTVRFNGRFGAGTSPFKGPPSPKVDKAWKRISEMGVIRISEDEFRQLNSSIHATRLPDSLGGGYMGLPEFVHQIHCVEMLWKASYPEYYSEMRDDIESDPQEMHDHMDHCADILRQKLMCDADMGIITYNWRKNHYRPHPNFNVQHKCRDFEAALQWGLDRQVDGSSLGGLDYFTRPDHPVVDFVDPPFDPLADE